MISTSYTYDAKGSIKLDKEQKLTEKEAIQELRNIVNEDLKNSSRKAIIVALGFIAAIAISVAVGVVTLGVGTAILIGAGVAVAGGTGGFLAHIGNRKKINSVKDEKIASIMRNIENTSKIDDDWTSQAIADKFLGLDTALGFSTSSNYLDLTLPINMSNLKEKNGAITSDEDSEALLEDEIRKY